MRLIFGAALAALGAVFAGAAFAQGQPDFSAVEIKTTPLGHNMYMLEGRGGNITVAVGDNAVIQVDGEFAPLHDKIKAAIDKVSGGKPIKYLIDTHFHGDHTGGNAPFHRDGATIVAHKNLALRLAHGTVNGISGNKTPPAEADAIPTLTYTTEGLSVSVPGVIASINHPPHAHTDTDSTIYFPAANVVSTGDIVSWKIQYVNVDYANGGNLDGIIKAVETFMKLGNDQTKYVPGHGPLATKADLQAYHDMLVDMRGRIEALITAHKTEAETIAAHPFDDIGKTLGVMPMANDNEVKIFYRSLKGLKANKL